jgi:hypothetical protein
VERQNVVQSLSAVKVSPTKIPSTGVKRLMSPVKREKIASPEPVVQPSITTEKVPKKKIRHGTIKSEKNVVSKAKGITNFNLTDVPNTAEGIKAYLVKILTISTNATDNEIKTALNILNGHQMDDVLRKIKIFNRKMSSTGSKPEKINKIHTALFAMEKIET